VTCCLGGDCESDSLSGSDSVTIEQDGCNVSYDRYVPGYGTFTRTGTIDGNNIYFSGLFLLPISGCTATQNVVDIYGTVDGDQIDGTGTGIARGTCDGTSFSCTGESTMTGTRLSSLFTHNALTDPELDRKPSATFSQSGKIMLFIVH
jgi:hypothetical protein